MRKLNHVGAYHAWVEQAFPDELARGERTRKLWRVDRLGNKSYLLLLSETRPKKEELEYYGVAGSYASKSYDLLLDSIQKGTNYQFRIALNPVHSVPEDGCKRGKVYPLYAEEDQLRFLYDRCQKHGFCIVENKCTIVEKRQERLRKKQGQGASLVKVVYEGLLVVEDVRRFRELLMKGMGREKAYGFGMMTVIRAN